MMKTKRLFQAKKISALYIILVTYILTFLIPLLTLFEFIFPKLETMMLLQFEDTLQSETNLYASRLNDVITNLNNYSLSLSKNATLSANILNVDSPLNRIIISEEFSKTISQDSYLAFSFLYSEKHQLFYSAENTYPSNWMNQSSDSSLYYQDFSHEQFIEQCQQNQQIKILPQKSVLIQNATVDCLTIIMPIKKINLNLIAIIPVEKLIPPLDSPKTLLIVDKNDQIIGGSLILRNQTYNNISSFNFIKNNTAQQRTVFGKKYLLHQSEINCDNLRVISIYEYEYAMENIHSLYQDTAKRGIIIFLMGIGLITVGILITYMPLKHLKNELLNTDTCLSTLSATQPQNEWNIISMSIKHLNAHNSLIAEQLKKLQSVTQELFLCRYLYGDIREENHIIEMANIYNIHIHDQMLCIAFGFLSYKAVLTEYVENLKKSMHHLTFNNSPDIESIRSAELLLILFFDDTQELRPFLKLLENSENTNVRIGVGSYERLNNPSRSNALALAALDIAKLQNTPTTINYSSIPIADNKHLSKALEQISLYDLAISQKSISQIQATFNSVLKTIFYSPKNSLSLQTLYINLYNTMVRNLNNMGKNHSPAYVPQDIPKEHNSMISTLENLQEELLKELTKYPEVESSTAQINQVLNYIAENYQDVNLSLLSISEEFGYSYSNFSHFFRKQTGSTFSNYLEHFRIDKAKILLKETDAVLASIAQQTGFNNIGTFTRAFKKQELVAPGVYRTNLKKHNISTTG